ncbi:MAG: helix-turn-helix transcriptional regulator [Acetobacteraceae bacterium]|nr:helix-turn-helix transcriptional regulator [Acetobacteraceae bacterium]
MSSPNRTNDAISAAQCRAARALLGWSREKLAEISGVPLRTLADFELKNTAPRATTTGKLAAALRGAGVEFIAENGGGQGVRLRKASGTSAA